MSGEELAQVGQQVVDAIVATYLPDGDDSLRLALHPGQAIADSVVQPGSNGPQSNALLLSEWIADQYDYPMLLKRADDTTVVSSLSDSITGKAGYAAMLPWATPTLPAEAPAYARVSSLISQARQSLGENPEVLPFGCEPGDFAEPDSPGWHIFDNTAATSHTETTTTEGQSAPTVRANPVLWQMRALPSEVVEDLPTRVETHRVNIEFMRDHLKRLDPTAPEPPLILDRAVFSRHLEKMVLPEQVDATAAVRAVEFAPERLAFQAKPLVSLQRSAARFGTAELFAQPIHDRVAEVVDLEPAPAPTKVVSELVRANILSGAMLQVGMDDLANAPAVTQTTTQSSELHVHFEYQLVRIIRRLAGSRWWREEFVNEPDWYVPGMRKGAMFDSPEGDTTLCLPQALIVVRNVSITGSWTDEARATMRNGITFVGPFLVAPPSQADESTTTGTSFSVLGAGIQVIGELCSPLPSLPPADDPSLAPA